MAMLTQHDLESRELSHYVYTFKVYNVCTTGKI